MPLAQPHAAKDFTVKLSTGDWRVVVTVPMGLTVYRPTMMIGGGLADTAERMDTFVHETLHASDPHLSETDVARLASDIVKVLRKAGYRLQN